MPVAAHHDYGIPWVNQDMLFITIEKCFAQVLGLKKRAREYPPDPFSVVAQAAITSTDFKSNMWFEEMRKTNKTISNSVGAMHQSILSLADNWHSMGKTGGVLDLRTNDGYIHPRFNKPVVAEVKNRFNTMRKVEESGMWDKIDQVSRAMDAQGYLFQITPETPDRYDMMWEPTGRKQKPNVRVCDGATAYEIVFGIPDALHQLYLAFPSIIEDVQRCNRLSGTFRFSDAEMERLYTTVFPS